MSTPARIHMIGNAHIDIVWLWQWTEGYAEVRSTFRSALQRIHEHDDFVFTSACALYYRMVQETEPELFEEIRNAVSEGRWYIAGGWWLQPDCNLPGGESFVRHGLYGQKYFEREFGRRGQLGYNVDSFGHHGNLPQILRKLDMSSYVFMRPQAHEKRLPSSVFRWRGIDGSEVTTFRVPPGYNNSSDWGEGLRNKIAMVADLSVRDGTPLMCFYGVGNHGGGPTKENLRTIDEIRNSGTVDIDCAGRRSPGQQESTDLRVDVVYSDPGRFFDEIRSRFDELPIVEDDLQMHAIGCYSVMARIKRLNNSSEHALTAAEKTNAVLERALSLPNRTAELRSAWERVLLNQFHDTIGGCSIPEAYPQVEHAYGYAHEIAQSTTTHALQTLASRIDTAGKGQALVLWNPHSWEVRGTVDANTVADAIYDSEGTPLPFQIVPATSIGNWFTHKTRFLATVPALGYAVYRLQSARTRLTGNELRTLNREIPADHTIEKGRLRVAIDRESGFVRSLLRTDTGVEYLSPPGIRPVIVDDSSDTWSHGISAYNERKEAMRIDGIRFISEGPVCSEYELSYRLRDSAVFLRLALYHDQNIIDLRGRVEWNEKRRLLQLEFYTSFADGTFRTEIPYGHLVRPKNGHEVPIQRWVSIDSTQEQGHGLCIANDGISSCSAIDNRIVLTLLRSPVYAHHDPAVPSSFRTGRPQHTDQGEHEFILRLIPHDGAADTGAFARIAHELNQPLLQVLESSHTGMLPTRRSYCRVDSPYIVITTIKRAEDGDGYVVRAVETGGASRNSVTVEFSWIERSATVDFGAFEIKTLRVSETRGQVIEEQNLLEELQGQADH